MTYTETVESVRHQLERRNIICPFCGHVQDLCDGQSMITYWGEEPPQETTCSECDKDFWVKEHVTREFECTKGKS